jgi:ribonuclease HI
MKEGTAFYGQSVKRRLSFSLRRYKTVFQAEIYAILACFQEIQSQNRQENYVSTCSNSQSTLKVLQVVRTTSPLVYHCQEALNDVSARHVVGLFWVPGHVRIRGNENADALARDGSALRLLRPEPTLGVSKYDIREKLSRWLISQRWASWGDLGNTLR